jgi:hypothetical protein
VEVAASAQPFEQQTLPHAAPVWQHFPSVVYPPRQSVEHLLPLQGPEQHWSPHQLPSQHLPSRMLFGSQHSGFPTRPGTILLAQTFPGGQHVPSKYGNLPAIPFVPQTRSFGQHRGNQL